MIQPHVGSIIILLVFWARHVVICQTTRCRQGIQARHIECDWIQFIGRYHIVREWASDEPAWHGGIRDLSGGIENCGDTREVPLAHSSGRHCADDRLPLPQEEGLEVGEEERAVLHDRTADAAAKLVLLVGRLWVLPARK